MDYEVRLSLLKLALAFLLTSGCGGNLFQESAGKNSEAAQLETIEKAINDQDYDTAITEIETSGILADSREKKNLFAAAYAGKCGVTFAGLIDALGAAAGVPFVFMMSSFSTVTTDAASCEQARVYLESIGTSLERTLGENLSFFLVGLGKVGTHLKETGDTAAPIGTFDPGFDACVAGDLSEANVKDIMSGFGMMVDTSAAVAAFLGGTLGADLTTIGTVCGASCAETDPSQINNAADILNFRKVLASNEYGAGTCALVGCCP